MKIKSGWKEYIYQYETPTIFKETLLRPFFDKLNFEGNLLDIGCGTGYFSELIASRGIKVIGIDQNPVKIKNPLAKYLLGEASSLPFENKSFNSILLINVLSAIDEESERIKVLKEAKRVIADTGKIYVVNPSENLTKEKINSDVFNFKIIDKKRIHLYLKKIDGSMINFEDYIITKKDMENYAKIAGLELIKIEDFTYFPLNLEVYSLYIYK